MNSMLNQIYRELTPKEQTELASPPFYVMRLKFRIRFSFKPNAILPDTIGIQEGIITPQEAAYSTTMITRIIPDESLIQKYRNRIAASYNENKDKDTRLDGVDFVGYEYINAVLPREEAKNVPTKDALYELVRYAWQIHALRIDADPNGDNVHGPVLFVDDDWLYFDSSEGVEDEDPRFYLLKHGEEYLVTHMTDAIWELYVTDPESPEVAFIFAYLYEKLEQPWLHAIPGKETDS